ncbi:MAG: uracil-DNA glycosylase [Verrucomicrobiota bacterium]
MRSQVEALIKELEIMKEEGITHVSLDPSALESLESLLVPEVSETSPQQRDESTVARKPLQARSRNRKGPSVFESVMNELDPAQSRRSRKSTPKAKANSDVEVLRTLPDPPIIQLPGGSKAERWNWLKERVIGCDTCQGQVKPGKQVVFGVGNLDAEVFLCGEAPGADEEVQGEPFVGPAGQLLNKILAAAGWTREQVYIGNIMNWRPDTGAAFGNRPPTDEELQFCLPYLKAQLEIIQPKVILALGKTAVKGLVYPNQTVTMGQVHGKWHDFEGIPVMPTYHPSYLLHNNTNRAKRAVWEDVLLVMEKLEKPISERQRGFFL